MSGTPPKSDRSALILRPGEGRSYPMGRISAIFKSDGAETAGRYSISEWWLEPHRALAHTPIRKTMFSS